MAPFDATLDTKISPLIDGQLPDFIQGDHPKFATFLKHYYQFMEAAELQCDGVINNIIQETISVNYIVNEDESKVVAETGVGTTGKFIEGETITGLQSGATAVILVDDLGNDVPRLFISCNQRFELQETIIGSSSGATAVVNSYRANPVQTIQQLLDYANTDNTTALMLDEMYRQFLNAIPSTLASGVSKRNLIKHIKDLYATKGTSEGHKLLLRLMFNETPDIFYPTKYMMRLSDGNWTKPSIIRCENAPGADGQDVIGAILTGQTSGATVFVTNATGFSQGSSSITEFEIQESSLIGDFVEGETLSANGVLSDVEQRFTIQRIVTGAIINDPGILYSVGDNVILDSGVGNGQATAQVVTVNTGNLNGVIVENGGQNYRVGDPVIFTSGDVASVPATGFVSAIGGSIILEDNDSSDGASDYLAYEPSTNYSQPENTLGYEDEDTFVLNGTDSSSTDADWYIVTEYATPKLIKPDLVSGSRIIFEEGTISTIGEISNIFITNGGSGYSNLPTATITTNKGTGSILLPTTNNIGSILDIGILDTGFNYKKAPNATVPAKFILSNISGTFSSGNTLSSHVGNVTDFNEENKILTCTIEDVIRLKMEQVNTNISENIQQEENTELTFSRLTADNVLEENSRENLISRGLEIEDAAGITVVDFETNGGAPTDFELITDATGSNFRQLNFEHESQSLITDERFALEERRQDGEGSLSTITDRVTNGISLGQFHSRDMPFVLDGTVIGGSILIEAGGTDGSGTNAGDEILLDGTDGSSTNAGSKAIQQSDDEGNDFLVEPHPHIENRQQRKDKFQLDGTSEQYHTDGGWVSGDQLTRDNLSVTPSLSVFIPATEGDDVKLENEDGFLILDGTSEDSTYRVTSLFINHGLTLNNGDKVKTEGVLGYTTSVPIDSFRVVDDQEGILLEDGASERTSNVKEHLILEGIDGNSAGADENGFYDIFENDTVGHGDDSSDRIIHENGDGLANEDSTDPLQNTTSSLDINARGQGDRIIQNNHVISNFDETILMVLNGTNASGTDAGDSIIFDGLSLTDRIGNTISLESGLAAGVQDDVIGDDVLMEPINYIEGNVLLDRTDDDDTDEDDNIVHETGENFIGQIITTSSGASATIAAAGVGKVTVSNNFISNAIGNYRNTDSLISEDVIRIQDSYYYQDFSYEVRIGQSVNDYIDQLKGSVHPSGFMPFGKVTIASLISAAIPNAGIGVIDSPEENFSPILASALEGIFNLKINQRLGIPKVYEEDNVFQSVRLEAGLSPGDIILDGTNYGIGIETDSSGNTELGIIMMESSKNEGDNILITGSDEGSQIDSGDQIILDGTDADGTNNVDVTGEVSYLILDATSFNAETEEINDAGSAIIYNGSALGVYNLIDADSNVLVLNGTDIGNYNRIVNEDGDDVGGGIVTDAFVDTSGKVQIQEMKLSIEDAIGGQIILNQTSTLGSDKNAKVMSEAAAGISDTDRDNLFIRKLRVKVAIPAPRPLNSVGLGSMTLDMFGNSFSVTNIQLEDALRKRGPTINVDRLLVDGVDVGEKDDINDIKFGGEPMQMEDSAALNLGAGISFRDFYRETDFGILLDGTDGSGTDAGDEIELETNWGAKLRSENVVLAYPMNDFLRPDILVIEGDYYKHSEWGRLVLDGTASDGSTGALNSTGYDYIVLDGIDAMQSGAGDNLLVEEQNDINKSFDDANDIAIRVENYEGGSVLLNGTDSSSSNAGDEILEEIDGDKIKQEEYGMESGELLMENDWRVYLLLERSDVTGTDDGTVIGLEDDSGSLLNELFSGYGSSMILEEGSSFTKGSKLILDSQFIEIESGINDGEIPNANWGDNSVFPSYGIPSDISTRPIGRLSIQDETAITNIVLDGTNGSAANAGDNLILNQSDAGGEDADDNLLMDIGAQVILDQSGGGQLLLQDGGYIDFENGTYGSLLGISPAFLPLGFEAESFDNTTRTTLDNTSQTFDVLEGA
jgi:hypothetical protein